MSKISENIAKHRKAAGLTQEALAEKLGVTFQAVSKWETAKSSPDIDILPELADIFACTIDDLFGREYINSTVLPWEDDATVRCVVFEGRKLLEKSSYEKDFTVRLVGDAKNITASCNLAVEGSVSGDCVAGHTMNVGCDVCGDCNAGHSIAVGCDVNGDVNTGHTVGVGGDVNGDIDCGANVSVDGDLCGFKVNCRDLNIDGDFMVKSDVRVEGSLTAGKNVELVGNLTVGGELKAEVVRVQELNIDTRP